MEYVLDYSLDHWVGHDVDSWRTESELIIVEKSIVVLIMLVEVREFVRVVKVGLEYSGLR